MSSKEEMYTSADIEKLIRSFDNSTIPKNLWTHEAHLAMAIWYSQKYTEEEALDTVRKKIKALNEFHGTPNSDSEGYHETLTIFWLENARQFIKDKASLSLDKICNSFILSEKGHRLYPLEFFSKEVLFSLEARKKWVDFDKKEF